jgi:hypothetical protein
MDARVGIETEAGSGWPWTDGRCFGGWAAIHRWKSRADVVGLGPVNARPPAPAVATRTREAEWWPGST